MHQLRGRKEVINIDERRIGTLKKAVITAAARTPVGAYLGSLKTVPSEKLLEGILSEVARRGNVNSADIDQVVVGDVLGRVPNVARVAALLAGYDVDTPAYTVDRQCGSSLQATVCAYHSILTGDARIAVAGGVESMSRMPYYLPEHSRYAGFRYGNFEVYDAFANGSENVQPPSLYPGVNMGLTAENVAKKYKISREAQDEFALDSQMKYKRARESGLFEDEIFSVEVLSRRGSFIFDTDEHPKTDTTMESLSKLKPAFLYDGTGTVTAGNASGMNDGASAVIVMDEQRADELGTAKLVRIVAQATAGVDPLVMGIGPVYSTQRALERAGLSLEDIDLFELNEAFAAQSLGCLIELGMQPGSPLYDRVNVNGGAIAHGHALGNSGTRILTTLIYEMKRRKVQYGLATLCIGGGQGISMIVENID
jgi:acetyl-CoA C-acetyltransferase